jgi:geranylgeranyl transferase type-2 subunit beta
MATPFLGDLHGKYVAGLAEKTDSFEHVATEHLRMSGVYWGLTAMDTLGKLGEMPTGDIADWVLQCQHPNGGFGGNAGHDPHLLYTLSAIQILAICDALDKLDRDLVCRYIASLQQPDGSFVGDEWGEVDTRFSYCALSALSILGRLHSGVVDVDRSVAFVASCVNFDGGFGCIPGAESHAGQVFCCVGALSIGNGLHLLDAELLGWWLAERQCDSGGLNGRPEKQADVCYSWWILSAMSILGKVSWIDSGKLTTFILNCQDADDGGIADRPGNVADVFHTFFGLAGLSLLGFFDEKGQDKHYAGYQHIDPTYALPASVVSRLGLASAKLTPSV